MSKKSRAGCFTCKQRKKKCDEKKPRCSSCQRLDLNCQYGLKLSWKEIVKGEDNINFNYNGDTGKVSQFSDGFINFSVNDVSASECLYEENITDYNSTSNVTSPNDDIIIKYSKLLTNEEIEKYRLNPLYGPRISEKFLFDLYINVSSRTKSFAGRSRVSNEFIRIVIPGCVKFPALYRSVLSLSALDLMKKELKVPEYEQDQTLIKIYNSMFMIYKNDALNFLHDVLDGFDIGVIEMLEEVVVTIILLCNIEITNRGNIEWVRYLSEASLIFSALTTNKIMETEIFLFAYKYFSLRYVLLLTTLDKKSFELFTDSTPWPIIKPFFQNNEIEPMFGCTPELLYIIYKVSIYHNAFETGNIGLPKFIAKLTGLWYKLDSLTQNETSRSPEVAKSAVCYFHSTKVYIYSILSNERLNDYLDGDLQSHTPILWNQLYDLSHSKMSLFFPNWCLFILIGTDPVCYREEQRVKTLQILQVLETNWPLSSVVQIRRAILTLWKTYDMHVVQDLKANAFQPPNFRQVLSLYKFRLALT